MLTTDMILAMVAWPAAMTLGVLSLLLIRAVRESGAAAVVAAAAVAAGFVTGYWGIAGRPAFPPPLDAKAALPAIAVVGVVVGLLWSRWQARRLLRWSLTLVFALGSMWLLLRAAIAFQWTPLQSVLRVAVLATGMVVMIGSAATLRTRVSTRLSAILLAAMGGLGAPLMLFSDSLLLAQLHGALGIAAATLVALVWLRPERIDLGGAAVVVLGVAWSLWVVALLFANMPPLSFVLLTAALPTALTASRLARSQSPRLRAVVTMAVVFALVGGSVATGGVRYMRGMQADDSPAAASDYGYGYGYQQ